MLGKPSTKINLHKYILSVALGILGLVLSRFDISYIHGPFYITLHWSFILPLLVSRAYGPKYALIAGVFGLGAAFPFILWPTNGLANFVTCFIYLGLFIYISYADYIYNKTTKIYYHPFVLFIPYIILATIISKILLPITLALNTVVWSSSAEVSMTSIILNSILIKEVVIQTIGLVFTSCLLRIWPVQDFFGLPHFEKQKDNTLIFFVSIGASLIAWLVFIVFEQIFIANQLTFNLFSNNNQYTLVSLIVFVFTGIVVSLVAMLVKERGNEMISKLRDKEDQIISISNNFNAGMIYQVKVHTDGIREFTYVSNSVEEIYGVKPEDVYKDPMLIYSNVHPEDIETMTIHENIAIESLSSFKHEARMKNLDGTYRWVQFVSTPKYQEDGSLLWDGVEFIIDAQKEKQRYIEHISFHDHLTQLYNRRFYEQELERLDREEFLPISMIMADVNGLKLTNDAFGHESGDELLVKVADIIRKSISEDQIAARIGGDEFVIILPNTSNNIAQELVRQIKEKLNSIELEKGLLSVSFGTHTRFNMKESISELFVESEDQMYTRKLSEGNSMRNETIKLIMSTLFEKNAREQKHCERVSELCGEIGTCLGMSEDDVSELKTAGLLHDIGKIGVEEYILNKDGKLTDHEWLQVKRHPEIGYQILRSLSEFAQISNYVLYHHERLDGTGYPVGLKANQIPLQSKILFIADAYDAMTSDRAYRKGRSQEYAISEINKYIGIQFDPAIAKVFFEGVLGVSVDHISCDTCN